jgi:TolB protein
MDADGSNARPLAASEAIDDEADLSPDGSKVVFFSGREGNSFIYVVNVDGTGLQKLTDGQGGDVSPRWSPDGSKIAFSRGGSLMVMNADGSDLRTIMQAQPASEAEPCRAGSFVGSWSPDGNRITYYSAVLRPGGPNTFWICAIDADGSNLEVLVSEPESALHAEPYWSPDGKKIVYRDDRDGNCSLAGAATCNYEIYMLDLETGEETNVTNHPALDIEPAWSPDGEWIIFASNRDDPNFDLYAIRPDGSDLRRILDDPASKDSYPSWR